MRIRTIINPSAGRQVLQRNVDRIIYQLLDDQAIEMADVIETGGKGDAYTAARYFQPWEADLVLAVGGDGTISEIVNGLIDGGHKTPLAILPAGTVNDFAFAMNIPHDIEDYCDMVKQFKTVPVDVGRVGSTCFLNVCAGGMLTDVAYKVPSDAKTVLGQLAYILSGALDLPAQLFRSIPLSIHSDEKEIREDVLLFIVANTNSVGGFRNLAPLAEVDDGLLDVLVIYRQNLFEFLPLMLQLVNGEHLANPKVCYFQTRRLEISSSGNDVVKLDLDGEEGLKLPVVIEAVPSALRLLVP